MSSYHPENLKLVDYAPEKVIELAELAAKLGVLIHIQGVSFGASRHESSTARGSELVADRNAKEMGDPARGPIGSAVIGKI